MKDRKGQRMIEIKEVIVRDDDQNYPCQLTDISATGISVSTWHFIPTYKEIAVLMEIEGKKVPMKGSVRWSIDADLARNKNGKMGILILDPPAVFLEYVKKVNG
jgi:hypothetical protein